MRDWGSLTVRLLFAIGGGCVGALIVSVPWTIAQPNTDVGGWGLVVLCAGVAVGAIIGWLTPKWSDW